ncbi:uncharacterized protein LOC107847393 [Capsicum annuum]|uniref:uncharacterized protein LOC107847393 n=1 Tax=Capsicum annuum TaxID=4072 RepID=UPI001FB0BB2E|nr:uncharacterized protein LOC107847393 [Capsicum annuum]
MTLCQLTGAHKPYNKRYLLFFKDCIGALDGTPQGQEILFINHKCTTSKANNIDGENVREKNYVHWVELRDMIANDICNA